MVKTIQGEDPSVTKVNYFKGNDPSKWKTNVSTYDYVNLGEIYKGIELRLKAYGDNVEKLFCVKPGADPEQIRISLSGIQPPETPMIEEKQPPESPFIKGDLTGSPSDVGWVKRSAPNKNGLNGLNQLNDFDGFASLNPSNSLTESPLEKGAGGLSVNEHGELEVETELGTVKFTKPVAYQEIDGKRVYVDVAYQIENCKMQNAEQGITHPSPLSRGEYKSPLLGGDSGVGKSNTDTDNGHESRIYSPWRVQVCNLNPGVYLDNGALFNKWRNQPYKTWGSNCKFEPAMGIQGSGIDGTESRGARRQGRA